MKSQTPVLAECKTQQITLQHMEYLFYSLKAEKLESSNENSVRYVKTWKLWQKDSNFIEGR